MKTFRSLYQQKEQEFLILGIVVALSIGVIAIENELVFAQNIDTGISTDNNGKQSIKTESGTKSANTTDSNTTSLSDVTSYIAKGFIRSGITPEFDPLIPYIIYGSWNTAIENKNLTQFEANFTMARINGTESHTHQITNFKPTGSVSLQGGPIGSSVIYSGISDVLTNGNPKWIDVQTIITIDNFDTINIALDTNKTDDHFNGQLIDGVVQSVKTPEGQELLLIVMEPAPIIIPALPQTTNNSNPNTNSSNNLNS